MPIARILICFAMMSGLAITTPTFACSVVNDYRVPTNLELVDQAELVMLGRVIGARDGEELWKGSILIEPIAATKGELPGETIALEGMTLANGEQARFAILSNPYDFEQAHPLSYIGGCIRYMFPKGTTALFFLERHEGKWRPAGGAFSRWAEDVLIADAPWIRLARFYAKVANAPDSERKALLEAERDRLAAMADDPVAQLMAADIARQLIGPNETWNEIMREAIGAEAAAEAAAEAMMDTNDLPEEVKDEAATSSEVTEQQAETMDKPK